MQWYRPMVVLLTLIAFVSYGCVRYGVVHRRNTPLGKESRIANGPETSAVRELTISAQPTVSTPHIPVTFLYSERRTGPEEEVVTYAEREYKYVWSPILYPGYVLILPWALGFMIAGVEETPSEHVKEWGCPTNKDYLYYGAIAVMPCSWRKGVEGEGPLSPEFKKLPDAEEIRPTGRTAENRHPMAQQPVQVKVAAHGVDWQRDTVLTVVTDAEGQQRIPLDSVFKDFPNAPLEVSVILTADEAQTTVHLDSQVSEAVYTYVRK